MDITVADTKVDGATIVTLGGELGIDTVLQLQSTLAGLIEAQQTRVVVDLTALEFCDSIGLSTFVDAHRRCAADGGYLRLAAPNPFLLRVLEVVGLLGRVPVYRTVPGAVQDDPADRSEPPTAPELA